MAFRLTLEATIEAPSDQEALRLMAERLLQIVTDETLKWPHRGHFGGFGYPMAYSLDIEADESQSNA